jgi:MFS family permease
MTTVSASAGRRAVVSTLAVLCVAQFMLTVASLETGLAGSEWPLVAGRAAQGVGAAMVSPTARPPRLRRFGKCEWTRH